MTVPSTLDVSIGAQVVYAGETFTIKTPLSMTAFLLLNGTSGEQVVAHLDDLSPSLPLDGPSRVYANDLVSLSARDWQEAQRRAGVIRPLAALDAMPAALAQQAAHRLTPVQGVFPSVTTPLEVVQMDHTVVDCMIVDEHTRQPIGRPYLTVGIDVYSRCITGFCLTLEPPSAVSVGLCLAHAVLDKETDLRRLEMEGEWPIWGKPGTIHVENAAEFYSEALRRGCDQHGIRIAHRPVGQPHCGGTIERVLGTVMQRVHTLPGTTFANPQDRGTSASARHAALTLRELARWLTLVIIGHYHLSVHSALHEPPIERF